MKLEVYPSNANSNVTWKTSNKNVVMEGRDITTVVFPNAEHKFFVTASIDCRAQRRYETLKEKGENVTLEEVKEMLKKRDYNDSHREISPLKQAEDAILYDNSGMELEDQMKDYLRFLHSSSSELVIPPPYISEAFSFQHFP